MKRFGIEGLLVQIIVHALLAAASLLPEDHRLFQNVASERFDILRIQAIVLCVRGNHHHAVSVEGEGNDGVLRTLHAHKAQQKIVLQNAVQNFCAVTLPDVETDLRMDFLIGGKKLRQNIVRRDGGNPQTDEIPVLQRPAAKELCLLIQCIFCVFIELLSPGRDLQAFGAAENEPGLAFLLQLPHMGADGGLGDIELLCGTAEASAAHHGDEGLKLFEVHKGFLC